MWMHINYWFKGGQELKEEDNKRMRNYLSSLIDHCEPYVKRYFYLYEDNPHLFIAFEIKDKSFNGRLVEIATDLYKPRFIKRMSFKFDTNEESNGEDYLNAISAWCETITNYPTLLEQQPGRIKGLLRLNHLIHCLMDMLYGNRLDELLCYRNQLKFYATKKALKILKKGL